MRDVSEHLLQLALHGVPAPDGLLTRDIAARQLLVHLRLFPAFSRQNFKFFPPKLSTNELITDLRLFPTFSPKILNFFPAYLFHLRLFPAFQRQNFKFFPAKTQHQPIISSFPVPPLPFPAFSRQNIKFFPRQNSDSSNHLQLNYSTSAYYLRSRRNF